MKNKMSSFVYYADNVSWVLLQDEVFVIDEITRNIYLYRNLSKEIWISIQRNNNLNKIVEQLAQKYNDDVFDMQKDTQEIIHKYLRNNIIRLEEKLCDENYC